MGVDERLPSHDEREEMNFSCFAGEYGQMRGERAIERNVCRERRVILIE